VTGKLAGRRALVTGASRGIGRGIALAFADAGADVAIGYRREQGDAEATVKAIEAKGRRAFAFAADVRDANAVAAMVHGARDALGGLDTVVANAGVPTRYEPIESIEVSYWQRVLDIDLNGVFFTMRAAIPVLREGDGGAILTVSSLARRHVRRERRRLRRGEGRRQRAHDHGRARERATQHPLQRDRAGPDRHRHGRRPRLCARRLDREVDPDAPHGQPRRGRPARGLPRLRRRGVDHRRGVPDRRGAGLVARRA
jgi:NAD(P)-dependent dehydrogenase (short-subunit alcohol dehydrogenase family)